MCTGGVACLYGTCTSTATDKTVNQVCVCHELYAGSQCGYRNGLLYFELPLASVVVFAVVVMGLRISDTAWTLLRLPESKQDYFAFPRTFAPAKRVGSHLRFPVGAWEGAPQERISLSKHRPVTRALIVLVVLLELLPFTQMTAIAFMPIVPWPTNSKTPATFLRLLLLHPFWEHQEASSYRHVVFYMAVTAVPGLAALAVALGVKRFPLFKPQPLASPAEDLCTLVLRAFSGWIVIPLMIALLLPLECLFVGFLRRGSLFVLPVYDPVCFSWIRLGHVALGFATTVVYSFLASGVGIQLNCESSRPQPTLWTDARYTRISHSLQTPISLSVIAFGNSNPLALCICCTAVGICLGGLNLWMRPCIYSLINWLRVYGAALVSWTGLVGIAACVIDDPTNKSTFEIWSLGGIALTAVTFSSLAVHYSEDFWFQLSLLKGRQWAPSTTHTVTAVVAAKEDPKEDGAAKGNVNTELSNDAHAHIRSFKPKLPPLHVLKKRSRRSIASGKPTTSS